MSGPTGRTRAIRAAADSEASRVPWPKSESLADTAFRPPAPVFGGLRFRINPLGTVFHGL